MPAINELSINSCGRTEAMGCWLSMRSLYDKFRGDDAWAETWRMGGAHQAKTREDEKGHQVEVTNNDNNKITEQGRV